MHPRIALVLSLGFGLSLAPSCACGDVGSEEEARIAYLGVDEVVTKALALGFAGFNAASSANIPAQADEGEESGTIDVTGQVDQGASANKGMRLQVALTDYSDGSIDDPETEEDDGIAIAYATAEGAPLALDMQLRDIPAGTVTGTLGGTVSMEGDLEGELELSITFSGTIEDNGDGGTRRSEGSTEVSGTATSANGSYDVDTTI
jgi:hypothetical protein